MYINVSLPLLLILGALASVGLLGLLRLAWLLWGYIMPKRPGPAATPAPAPRPSEVSPNAMTWAPQAAPGTIPPRAPRARSMPPEERLEHKKTEYFVKRDMLVPRRNVVMHHVGRGQREEDAPLASSEEVVTQPVPRRR